MTTKTKKKTATPPKKIGTDIPLENIPERTTRTAYPAEFKKKAADRVIAGEVADQVARDMGIPSSSVIHGWVAKVRKGEPLNPAGGTRTQKKADPDNVAAMLKQGLERAMHARDERLEAAASIVEADIGSGEATQIAKKIRAFKRQS